MRASRFVVLLDLDDTLIPDRQAARAAVARTLQAIGLPTTPAAVQRVFDVARRRWRSGPYYVRLRDLGVSSWEALWADLMSPAVPQAAAWGRHFREQVWSDVLQAVRASSAADPAEASRLFVQHRRELVRPFPEAVKVVDRFARDHEVWLITNGASRLQQLKIRLSGLEDRFARVFISSDVGYAKPHSRFFRAVSDAIGSDKAVCLVVGDSFTADVRPAAERGWPAVHVCGADVCTNDSPHLAHVRGIGEVLLPCAH